MSKFATTPFFFVILYIKPSGQAETELNAECLDVIYTPDFTSSELNYTSAHALRPLFSAVKQTTRNGDIAERYTYVMQYEKYSISIYFIEDE